MAHNPSHIKRYFQCMFCGWYREINLGRDWKEEVISHPRYGRITNIGAAMWDVKTHDCESYMEAKTRWITRTGKKRSASVTVS